MRANRSQISFFMPHKALQNQRKRPKAALWLDGRHVSSLGLSGTLSLAVKLGEFGGFNYRVILPLGAS